MKDQSYCNNAESMWQLVLQDFFKINGDQKFACFFNSVETHRINNMKRKTMQIFLKIT